MNTKNYKSIGSSIVEVEKHEQISKTRESGSLHEIIPCQPKRDYSLVDGKKIVVLLIGISCCIGSSNFIEAGLGSIIGKIAYEFQDSKNLSWYTTSFLLPSTVFQLLAVRISDCFGRRRVLLFSIALMCVSSIMCGFSTNNILFLFFRVIQGCGSGICQSLVIAAIIDLFSLEDRIKYQPVINASYGITNIIAPVIAGVYADHLTWRCTFWTTTILTIPSFVIMYFLLNIPLRSEQRLSKSNLKLLLTRRIDPIGCLLATAGIVLFLLGLNLASFSTNWSSTLVVGLLAGALATFICFILFEKFVTPWPLFPKEMLIENRNLVLSYILVFNTGCHYIMADLLTLIEFQTVYGATATEAGLCLIPSIVAFIIANIVASKAIQKLGDIKYVNIAGNVIICIGALMMIFVLQEDSSRAVQILCTVVYIAGTGVTGQVIGLSTQMILEENGYHELAASSMALVRCLVGLSALVCTAISLALLQTEVLKQVNTLPDYIYAILRDSGVLQNFTQIKNIHSEAALQAIRSIYLKSFRTVYYMFLAWAIVGVLASIVMKVPKIKTNK